MKRKILKVKKKPISKRIVKKIVRRKNPDVDEIELNFEEIYKMARSLSYWNVKYDSFPDLKKWINKNYTLGNGEEKQVIIDYLYSIAAQRDASYMGIQPWSLTGKRIKEEHDESLKKFQELLKKYKFKNEYLYWP